MAELAQRLNELASANAEGLLNEEEYRLLRQDLFERYSGGPGHSSPPPPPVVHVQASRRQVEFTNDRPIPVLRSKPSVASGMATFIRKATGMRLPSSTPAAQPSTDAERTPSRKASISSLKRSFLPRVLSRKSSSTEMATPSIRSASTISRNDSFSTSSSSRKLSMNSESDNFSPPLSPTSRHLPTSPRFEMSAMDDVFDDKGFVTTKDIRKAILDTEAEGRKVLEAFDGLEQSVYRRLQSRHHYRRPSATPSPLEQSPAPSLMKRSVSDLNNDVASIRSHGSSKHATLNRQKTQGGPSPYSYLAPSSGSSLGRKNSVSSLSSQNAFLSGGKVLKSSRSTGHLPLHILKESMISTPPVYASPELDEEAVTELADIRKRRTELVGRYDARVEYLRARLKGAELHEKLLRK